MVQKLNADGQRLTISLSGRVDSTNAMEVDQQIAAIRKDEPHACLEIDMQDLTYISSMGLRVMLSLRKSVDMELINLSQEVWNVFEMTGFNQMIKMRKAFRRISVEGCVLLGEGANGSVYRLDDETIVKLYRPGTSLTVIDQERSYAQTAFLAGMPTAIPFDVVREGNRYGIVFELIDASTFDHMLTDDRMRFDAHVADYVSLLMSMHETDVEIGKLPDMKDKYHVWIDMLADKYTAEERRKMHRMVEAVPDSTKLLHGDFHPRNIMTQGGELLLIDMADISTGHPIFDLAGVGLTHKHYPTISPETCTHYIGLTSETLMDIWGKLLAQYFSTDDEAWLAERARLILAFTHLRYAINPAVISGLADALVESQIAFGKRFVAEECAWATEEIKKVEWKAS
ncbi:MAG: phosphotransferase [Bacteroidaceae bacterium]|nr:phosphotransferase [Bacteroidaceae bacterium]